jgi:hypothetical protein
MKPDDLEDFAEIMAVLNETFGDSSRSVSDIKMRFYFRVLSDLTIGELEDATVMLAQTKTIHTFPTPAEIGQAVEGNPHDKAVLAFDKLIDAVRTIGPYKTVIFDDPAIHAYVMSYGGWEEICDKTIEDWKYMRLEFLKFHAVHTRRPLDVPLTLTGIHEATNRLKGLDHPALPSIVGDKERALEWTKTIAKLNASPLHPKETSHVQTQLRNDIPVTGGCDYLKGAIESPSGKGLPQVTGGVI